MTCIMDGRELMDALGSLTVLVAPLLSMAPCQRSPRTKLKSALSFFHPSSLSLTLSLLIPLEKTWIERVRAPRGGGGHKYISLTSSGG